MNFRRIFPVGLVLFALFACGPSTIKHIRVQRHVDTRPTTPFLPPLAHATILSSFGPRGRGYHTGLDLRGKRGGGDTVRASRAGRVMSVGVVRGYGKQIEIVHSDGFKSRYAHLRSIKVTLGQTVDAGQPIGIVGRTGRATTAHLHFEIITPDGYFIDPALLLH